ncbi:MAG: segregation/condensation protein A [Oscillospiraceae bacterium]|nr:segregation/condensation protein A [Oscillospiraceae bacterium]
MEQEPTYHLEGVIRSRNETEDFEGPLTLILMLLSKNKIEIRDIQISEILEQYLAWLEEMKALDLEVASEFVQMAAHLLYIKTRMLLAPEEEGATELELLIQSLEAMKARDAYSSVKETVPALARAAGYGSLYWEKPPEPLPAVKEYRYSHETWELLLSLSAVFRRGRTAADGEEERTSRLRLFPKRIVYPVREKSREILLLLSARERASIRELYGASRSRSEVVAVFLSVLELCSMGHTHLTREDGELYVSFTGGDLETVLETIPE